MRRIAVLSYFFLASGIWADPRTYDEVSAVPQKTVVDFFLLCPDLGIQRSPDPSLFEVALGAPEGGDPAQRGRDFLFRQKLLTKGQVAPGLKVTSVLVDQKNAYIKIEGVHRDRYPFSLVFVYFENAQKARIPALTYHYEAMEEETDFHRFYDLSGGSWQPIPNDKLFGEISEKLLIPYAGTGDASNIAWALELPQYGTTVRFLPRQAAFEGDTSLDYLARLEKYALECSWNKTQARFDAAKPVWADKTDVPKGKPQAADLLPLLPGQSLEDLGLAADSGLRKARDQWKAQKTNPADYFHVDGNPDLGHTSVSLKLLGQYQGLPLVAQVSDNEQIHELFLWVYHPESGLLEPSSLLHVTGKDFYQGVRKSEVPSSWTMGHMSDVYAVSAEEPGVSVSLDTWHDQDLQEFPPDFELTFVWDDKKQSFVKTEKRLEN